MKVIPKMEIEIKTMRPIINLKVVYRLFTDITTSLIPENLSKHHACKRGKPENRSYINVRLFRIGIILIYSSLFI
jgi:hypothetical protein